MRKELSTLIVGSLVLAQSTLAAETGSAVGTVYVPSSESRQSRAPEKSLEMTGIEPPPAEEKPAEAAPKHAPPKAPKGDAAQPTAAEPTTPPENLTSAQLAQAYSVYHADPQPETFKAVLHAVKQLLIDHGKAAPGALIKSNPSLLDLGTRAIDAGSGHVYQFAKVTCSSEVIVQWVSTKTEVTYTGRRRRVKHVHTTSVTHLSTLNLPPSLLLKDARIFADGSLVLVGAERGSTLWLRAFKQIEGTWTETAGRFNSIPEFLTNNVSGRVSFRGQDLIFTVARVVTSVKAGATTTLAEADSSTYKFWLHLTEQGYVLMPHLPDEAHFAVVKQFLDAVGGNRTDIARSLLKDTRLLSIPKYVGVHGSLPSYRVAEMATPPQNIMRFRLITGAKDDLIFDVGHVKDKTLVRGIFIAPPDPFLAEIAGHLPTYGQILPPPKSPEQISVQK